MCLFTRAAKLSKCRCKCFVCLHPTRIGYPIFIRRMLHTTPPQHSTPISCSPYPPPRVRSLLFPTIHTPHHTPPPSTTARPSTSGEVLYLQKTPSSTHNKRSIQTQHTLPIQTQHNSTQHNTRKRDIKRTKPEPVHREARDKKKGKSEK